MKLSRMCFSRMQCIHFSKVSSCDFQCLCYLQAGAMLGDAFLHQLPHAFGMIWIQYFTLVLLTFFFFFKFKI